MNCVKCTNLKSGIIAATNWHLNPLFEGLFRSPCPPPDWCLYRKTCFMSILWSFLWVVLLPQRQEVMPMRHGHPFLLPIDSSSFNCSYLLDLFCFCRLTTFHFLISCLAVSHPCMPIFFYELLLKSHVFMTIILEKGQ